MDSLTELAGAVADRLKKRGETIAIAESSTGGLVSAALLSVPGASAYFLGGAVVYTQQAREGLLAVTTEDMAGIRAATEAYASLNAGRIASKLGADWGLAETGASGPTGNRYGDAAGHACFAVAGPVAAQRTLETGSDDRSANMRTFGRGALELLLECIDSLSESE